MSTRTGAPSWPSGIMSAIRDAFRDGGPDEEVHFHNGPAGRPVPCFDRHCARPKLDPWAYEVECMMLAAEEITVRGPDTYAD